MLPIEKESNVGNKPDTMKKLDEMTLHVPTDNNDVLTIVSEIDDLEQQMSEQISLPDILSPLTGAVSSWEAIIKDEQNNVNKKIDGYSEEDIQTQINEQLRALRRSECFKVKRIICKGFVSEDEDENSTENHIDNETENNCISITDAIPSISSAHAAQPIGASASDTNCVLPYSTLMTPNQLPNVVREPTRLIIEQATGEIITITEGELIAVPTDTLADDIQLYILFRFDSSAKLTALNSEELEALNLSATADK